MTSDTVIDAMRCEQQVKPLISAKRRPAQSPEQPSDHRPQGHWLSDGEFGAEASVMALALCLLGSATLLWLWLSLRRGSLLAPGWWRAR